VIRQSIVGWTHSQFGKFPDRDVEDLLATVAVGAIADAGIEPSEVDAVFVGTLNSGFSKQDFAAPLAMQYVPELRFKPATRCENACASGNAALVVGVEKMSGATSAEAGNHLLGASYRREEADIPAGFVGVFGRIVIAQTYF